MFLVFVSPGDPETFSSNQFLLLFSSLESGLYIPTPTQTTLSLVPTGTGYIGFGLESVPGVATYPRLFLPAETANVSYSRGSEASRLLKRSVERTYLTQGVEEVNVRLSTQMVSAGLGMIFRSLLSTPGTTVAQGTNFLHQFFPQNVQSYVSTETATEGTFVTRHAGMMVESATISCSFGEPANVDISLVGLSSERMTEMWNPDFYEVEPLTFKNAKIMKNDVELAQIISYTIDVSNSLTRNTLLSKNRSSRGFLLVGRDIDTSLEIDGYDTEFFDEVANENEVSLVFELYNDINDAVTITLPRVSLSGIDFDILGTQNVTGSSFDKDSRPIVISVSNSHGEPV
jgi:hypothetical protein